MGLRKERKVKKLLKSSQGIGSFGVWRRLGKISYLPIAGTSF